MKQKEQETKFSKKSIVVVIIVLSISALVCGGAIWFLNGHFKNQKENKIETLVNNPNIKEDISETEEVVLPEPVDLTKDINMQEKVEDIEEEPESIIKNQEPLTQESILVRDIAVFPNEETAVFICYAKEAVEYKWEYYSVIDRKWSDVIQKKYETYMEIDSLNRNVSCLNIPIEENNDLMNVRCTIIMPEGENIVSEGTMYLFTGEIKDIKIPDMDAEAGSYLSSNEVKATIVTADGAEKETTGLQCLSFYVLQNEETILDSQDSLTTETNKKIYKESPYYFVAGGEQEVTIKVSCREKTSDIKVNINGMDTLAPIIEGVRANNEVSAQKVESTKVKIYATVTDNFSIPSEIEYALSLTAEPKDDLNWQNKLPIESNINKNGVYYFIAKDAAGNIASEEVEIIGVDMKAPVIEDIKLIDSNKKYNVEVLANDKTDMEYCFIKKGEENLSWQKENTYEVSMNGIYVVRVKDAAGNTSEGMIEVDCIDNTPPIIKDIFMAEQSGGKDFSVEMVPDIAGGTLSSKTKADTTGITVPTGKSNITITSSGSTGIAPQTNGTISSGTRGIGIQGAKGDRGETGTPGVSSYVHIRYAKDERGTSMTYSPSIDTKYIGIYTGTSKTGPTAASSYQWSLYQGENTNVYIKYASSNKGDNMTNSPTNDSLYIGFSNTTDTTAPTDPLKYEWSKYKQDAENVYVRYSSYENGDFMTESPEESSKYIGICTTIGTNAPTDPSVYQWSQYKGNSAYLHIKYSAAEDGSNMKDSPSSDSKYIGICNSNNAQAPTDATLYKWMWMAGQDGNNSYVHIKYGEDADGTNMTEVANENCSHMGICVSNNAQAPVDASEYSWCKISFGREVVEMKQSIEVMQAQIDSMRTELEELKNR